MDSPLSPNRSLSTPLRWAFYIFACILIGALGFYYYVGAEGATRWKEAVENYKKNGGTLDPSELRTDPIPDEQNYASIRSLKGITIPDGADHSSGIDGQELRGVIESACEFLDFSDQTPNRSPRWGRLHHAGPRLDILKWHNVLVKPEQVAGAEESPIELTTKKAAEEVLHLIDRELGPILEQSDNAVSRPQSRLTPSAGSFLEKHTLDKTLNNYGYATNQLAIAMMLRAVAAAHLDQPKVVSDSIRAVIHLATAESPPDLGTIQHLYFITRSQMAYSALAEALAQRALAEDELAAIQDALLEIDASADLKRALQFDLIGACDGLDKLKAAGSKDYFKPPIWYPDGWIDENRALILDKGFESWIEPCAKEDYSLLKERDVALEKWIDQIEASGSITAIKTFFAHGVLSSLRSLPPNTTYTQALANQAQIACALERYFLKHGSYPESLDYLKPEFFEEIPTDPMDEAPMRYRKSDSGRYILYSIGWNLSDELGIPSWDPKVPGTIVRTEGDWVWAYEDLSPTPAPVGGP